jgi:hypothetical protein
MGTNMCRKVQSLADPTGCKPARPTPPGVSRQWAFPVELSATQELLFVGLDISDLPDVHRQDLHGARVHGDEE